MSAMLKKTAARPWLLVGGLLVASALILGVSVSDTAARDLAFGTYHCCGYNSCSVLVATNACPQGDSQCTHLPDQGGHKAKCCMNYCNDPHPAEEMPTGLLAF